MSFPSREKVISAADAIEGTSAEAILLETSYLSFCSGADLLERVGIWTDCGEVTELGYRVREECQLRARARRVLSGFDT